MGPVWGDPRACYVIVGRNGVTAITAEISHKLLKILVGGDGLEPPTLSV